MIFNLKKHNVVDWDIGYFSFVGNDKCFFDMVIFIFNKGVQRTVDGVVLSLILLLWEQQTDYQNRQ